MNKKKTNPLDQAFAALLNDDDAKALEALALIHERGDATAIFPLLHALSATDSPARQRRIKSLLFDVKVKEAAAEFARALDTPELLDVRKTVIAAFWNANLDAGPYIGRLVEIAVDGDAEETFEVLTVMENQHGLPMASLHQALERVNAALANEQEEYKLTLLGSLRSILEEHGHERPA